MLAFQYLIFTKIKKNSISVIKTAVFSKYELVLGIFFLLLFIGNLCIVLSPKCQLSEVQRLNINLLQSVCKLYIHLHIFSFPCNFHKLWWIWIEFYFCSRSKSCFETGELLLSNSIKWLGKCFLSDWQITLWSFY